ncbi:MAG: DUF5652 family protein [Patescibacteria group bacterium]
MDALLNIDPKIIALIVLWSLPWKGIALWRAAQREHRGWFIALLLLNTFALLDMYYLYFIARGTKDVQQKEVESGEHNHVLDDPVDMWMMKRAELKEALTTFVSERGLVPISDAFALLDLPEGAATHIIEELVEEGVLKKTTEGLTFATL